MPNDEEEQDRMDLVSIPTFAFDAVFLSQTRLCVPGPSYVRINAPLRPTTLMG